MKVLFVSDIHGSFYYASKIKEIYMKECPDVLVVLGDLYYHGTRNDLSLEFNPMKVAETFGLFKNNMYVIKGNCDAEVDEMISEFTFYDNLILDINGKKVFCTHGHKYNVNSFPKQEFDIMAYGHLHTGFIKEKADKLFINPGSISFPRGGTVNSYILMSEEGIYLKDIEFNIVDKYIF